jgi:hypothetical protein
LSWRCGSSSRVPYKCEALSSNPSPAKKNFFILNIYNNSKYHHSFKNWLHDEKLKLVLKLRKIVIGGYKLYCQMTGHWVGEPAAGIWPRALEGKFLLEMTFPSDGEKLIPTTGSRN